MTRNDRDYEKLKAFADQLRKENKKLQEQIEKILFERNNNEVTKRSYETQIKDLKTTHERELAQIRLTFGLERVEYNRMQENHYRLQTDLDRMTAMVRDLQGRLGIPTPPTATVQQWDGIRKLYIDD